MQRVIHDKSIFSHGVLQTDLYLIKNFAESGIKIDHVDFYEYVNGKYEPLDGEVDVIETKSGYNNEKGKPTPAQYLVYLEDGKDHLVKAEIYVDPTMDSNAHADMPCCAQLSSDGKYWLFEEFFVDLSAYKTKLLNSVNLKCDDCDVAIGTVNDILKIHAVEAAVEMHDPALELIYSKITCGKRYNTVPARINKQCNCNG